MSSELTKAASALLGETVPGVKDILRIGISLAKTAEKIPGMKGAEKMEAVLTCLREILSGPIKEKLTAEELAVLTTTVDTVIPVTITLLIDASRAGDFVKKNIRNVSCVPCMGKKTEKTPVAPVDEKPLETAENVASTEIRAPENLTSENLTSETAQV